MKKKRGSKSVYKRGKQKENSLVADLALEPGSANLENDTDLDEDEHLDSKIENISPTILRDVDAELPSNSPSVKSFGRVKVKLKTSKPLEVQHSHSDLQSDSGMSQSKLNTPGQKLNMENQEDSGFSDGLTSDLETTISKSPKKSGSIKIISSKGINTYMNKKTHSGNILGDRGIILSDNEKIEDAHATKIYQSGSGPSFLNSGHNERALSDALVVIKKVMKMDAAEPFNMPVDPVALGIPDYFDVIDTPMDFGTICKSLEHGQKYTKSEDVFKDVQLIWDNCNKYNNKGDYIIDLMKRVKKNFMKYWLAAGLYCEVAVPGATEATNGEENKQFHQDKSYAKGKMSKHKRRRLGTNHHKNGCLCAVCVVRRQKKEREGIASLCGKAATSANSNMEPNEEDSEHSSMSLSQSPTNRFIVDAEELDHVETEDLEFQHTTMEEHHGRLGLVENEMEPRDVTAASASHASFAEREIDDLDFKIEQECCKLDVEDNSGVADEKAYVEKCQKHAEHFDQLDLYEDPLREENQSIVQICAAIFSRDCRSIWNGPHSLTKQVEVSSKRASPLLDAISTFLKK